jgi:hypothetical protein
MIRLLTLILVANCLTSLFSQQKFFPTGVVMKPFEVIVADAYKDSVARYTAKGTVDADFKKKFIPNGLPSNWKTIRTRELAIMNDQDFGSFVSLALNREINYILLINNENLLIYCLNDSVNTALPTYNSLLQANKVDWMINPNKITLAMNDGKLSLTAAIQVYYRPTGFLNLNTTVSVAEDKVKDSCTGSTLDCLIGELTRQLAVLVTDKINRMR